MAKHWIRIFLFFALVITPFPLMHVILRDWSDRFETNKNKDAIFVWGDSQMLHGLDVEMMREHLGRDIFNYAADSAGLYDLEVFLDRVPTGVDLLLSANEEWVARLPSENYNRSGFSLKGWVNAANCDYSLKDLYNLFLQNRNPFQFKAQTRSMPISNTKLNNVVYEMYKKKADGALPEYYQERWRWVSQIIERVEKKGRKVVWVEFPLSSRIRKVREKNPAARLNSSSNLGFSSTLKAMLREDSNFLILKPETDEVFSDDTHMNIAGRNWATKQLIQKFKN